MVRTDACVLNINESHITQKTFRLICSYFITGTIRRRDNRLPWSERQQTSY